VHLEASVSPQGRKHPRGSGSAAPQGKVAADPQLPQTEPPLQQFDELFWRLLGQRRGEVNNHHLRDTHLLDQSKTVFQSGQMSYLPVGSQHILRMRGESHTGAHGAEIPRPLHHPPNQSLMPDMDAVEHPDGCHRLRQVDFSFRCQCSSPITNLGCQLPSTSSARPRKAPSSE